MMNANELIADIEKQHPQFRTWEPYEQLVHLILWRDLQESIDYQLRSEGKETKSIQPTMIFEVLSIIDPTQREFWLRCEATVKDRWINGLIALFNTSD